jgi:hypothetical protein
MNRLSLKHVLCAVAGLTFFSAAFADEATESRLREALRSATEQVQQLQQEKATLQAQKAAPASAAKDAKLCERQAARASTGRATDTAEIAKLQTALKFSVQTATDKNGETAKAQSALTEAKQRVKTLEEKNAKLVALSKEILARYENVGLGEAFGAKEPFVGTARVSIQNFAQDYGDKIDDNEARP